MGLPWIRQDTSLNDHPKILELVADKAFQAISAHFFAKGYTGKHATAGYIPRSALPFCHCRVVDAQRLVAVGLWEPAPGGWVIHGWAEHQHVDEAAVKRSEKAQRAATARWEKERGKDSRHMRAVDE